MLGEQSRLHKEGQSRISTRALLKGAGFTDEEIAKPFIGIACSWQRMLQRESIPRAARP